MSSVTSAEISTVPPWGCIAGVAATFAIVGGVMSATTPVVNVLITSVPIALPGSDASWAVPLTNRR